MSKGKAEKARRAVEKQRERLAKIEARLGWLMTARADAEEKLAALITAARAVGVVS